MQNEGVQVLAAEDPGAAVLLDDYRALRDGQLRRSLEAEHGLFIAEGTKIIVRALEAGLRPRSLLLTPRWWEQLRPHLPDGSRLPVVLADEQFTEHLTGFHVHRGALGSFERPTPRTVDQVAGPARRLMVVEDLVDHTNLGAIIRSAAALDWDGLLLSHGSADPLYRRAIKTAMGTVFTLPWARLTAGQGPAALHDLGFTVVALALRPDALPIDQVASSVRHHEKVALLLGTEGSGLSQTWLDQCDLVAMIPMANGVDSLNVAAAATLAGYLFGR